MKELSYLPEAGMVRSRPKTREREKVKPARRWLVWTASLLVWGLLVYGSFILAQHYIQGLEQQLTQIQTSADLLNQTLGDLQAQLNEQKAAIDKVHDQFAAVESELEAVKEQMALAGSSLSSSDETKKALNQRITDLSKELENLRNSIKRLEEAARVY